MRPYAYYNEIDSKAAAWIRELIKAKLITDGEVDERSIEDIVPNDLTGFARCHFFSGIAVWDYALNQAGYDRWDQVTWTGSCPCQPFSAAGKRGGTADERHLWPAFYYLISQCRPDVVFGEQVASSDGLAWLDLVYSDLEAAGYAVGALDLCAAGFGAPHIRQRLFFVADSSGGASERNTGAISGAQAEERREDRAQHGDRVIGYSDGSATSLVADAKSSNGRLSVQSGRSREANTELERNGKTSLVADADGEQEHAAAARGLHSDAGECGELGNAEGAGSQGYGRPVNIHDAEGRQKAGRLTPTAGFWSDAEWLYCRDGKYRAVEPGISPLAHGAAARVGRLRGYGNAIVAPVAEAFIRAYLKQQ